MVTTAQDVLEEYGLDAKEGKKKDIFGKLDKIQQKALKTLLSEPMSADELSKAVKKPISDVLKLLSLLEIKGVIEKTSEGKYHPKANFKKSRN